MAISFQAGGKTPFQDPASGVLTAKGMTTDRIQGYPLC